MRVVHISTFDTGGAGLACIRLHKGLLENRIDSKVIVLKKTKEEQEVYQFKTSKQKLPRICQWIRTVFKLTLNQLRIPLSQLKFFQYKLSSISGVNLPLYSIPFSEFDILENSFIKDADIIHLHWIAGFLDFPSFFKKVNKPVIWTLHDENIYYGGFHYTVDYNRFHKEYQKLEKDLIQIKMRCVKQCRELYIISLSKMMLDFSLSSYIVRSRKHYVINNPVDTLVFRSFNQNLSREIFSLPSGTKILLFVSYYLHDARKGLELLIDALNELKLTDVALATVGIGKINVITQLEIFNLGPIYDERLLSIAYSACDALVLPSFQEGFAQTPLEAMSCGLPVICFPCSGTEELIHEKNGIRTENFTVNELKKAIMKFLFLSFDKELIRKDVAERFGIQFITEQYCKVYNNILDERSKVSE